MLSADKEALMSIAPASMAILPALAPVPAFSELATVTVPAVLTPELAGVKPLVSAPVLS
jgi:hypothetical protein